LDRIVGHVIELLETVTIKELKAAVGTGSDKLQFAGLKMASIEGHGTSISGEESQRIANRRALLCASRPKGMVDKKQQAFGFAK